MRKLLHLADCSPRVLVTPASLPRLPQSHEGHEGIRSHLHHSEASCRPELIYHAFSKQAKQENREKNKIVRKDLGAGNAVNLWGSASSA